MMLLAETTIRVTVVVAVGLAAVAAFHARSAALRHWVLAAALLCAAAVPLLGPIVPGWTSPIALTRTVPPPAASAVEGLVSIVETPGEPMASAIRMPIVQPRVSLASIVVRVWIVGMLVSLAVLLVGLSRLWWVAAHSALVTEGAWWTAASDVAQQYGLRRRLRLLQSDHPTLLVTWGFAHPAVILPRGAEDWAEDRMRIVLAHELAHVRRCDWALHMAAELLRAAFWFNPLVWVATRRLRDESEQACDDAVLRQGVEGTDYAAELVELARVLTARRHPWFPAPAMARPSSLERRVIAMLNDRVNRSPISSSARLATAVTLVALATLVAGFTASAQTFVSFSGSVVDQFGGAISGATVALTNGQNNQKYEVRSNAVGVFEFVGLMTGEYELQAGRPGFSTLKDRLSITGRNPHQTWQLRVGELEETITVVDRANGGTDAPRAPRAPSKRVAAACVPTAGGGVLTQPMKIADMRPVYPKGSGDRLNAKLEFEAVIGEDGSVRDVRLANPNAEATIRQLAPAAIDLSEAAMAAVRQWRYTPTLLNCVPVEVTMRVHVNFRAE